MILIIYCAPLGAGVAGAAGAGVGAVGAAGVLGDMGDLVVDGEVVVVPVELGSVDVTGGLVVATRSLVGHTKNAPTITSAAITAAIIHPKPPLRSGSVAGGGLTGREGWFGS